MVPVSILCAAPGNHIPALAHRAFSHSSPHRVLRGDITEDRLADSLMEVATSGAFLGGPLLSLLILVLFARNRRKLVLGEIMNCRVVLMQLFQCLIV